MAGLMSEGTGVEGECAPTGPMLTAEVLDRKQFLVNCPRDMSQSGGAGASDFLKLDRAERRHLAVLSPGRLAAAIAVESPEGSEAASGESAQASGMKAAVAGGLATGVLTRQAAKYGLAAAIAPQVFAGMAMYEYLRYKQQLRQRSLPGLPVSIEAARALPIHGELTENSLYVCHPYQDVYLSPADFHRYVFLTKIREAGRVFGALGATSAKIVSRQVDGKSISAKLRAIDPFSGAGGGGSFSKDGSALIDAERTLEWAGSEQPRLDPGADPLEFPWYAVEPSWHDLYEQRALNRLTSATFQVSYLDSFGVDGDLSASAQGVELGIGGKSIRFSKVAFEYEVKFPGG